jgi:dipeptidyl-peptidase 4
MKDRTALTAAPQTPDLRASYQAAEQLLPHRWKELVTGGQVRPNWISGGDRFWYIKKSRAATEYVLVDPAAGSRELAFEPERAASALASVLGRPVEPGELPIDGLEVRDGEPLRLHVDGRCWLWDSATATVIETGEPAPDRLGDSVSPDGRWLVSVRDDNVVARERATGTERRLTDDGVADRSYGTQPDISNSRFTLERLDARMPPAVAWSPDSRRLLTHRIDQRGLPLMHYVRSNPPDGGRPRLYGEHYAMVGDNAVPTADIVVIDLETGERTWSEAPPIIVSFRSPITLRKLWWAPDGRSVYVISGERGERTIRLQAMDPDSGATKLLVEESADTNVNVQTGPIHSQPPIVHVLATGETVWWSERTGWGHLYLYTPGGSVRALTSGEWLVRDLVAVDEEARAVVFAAAGREPGLDPYVRQLYRVGLDDGAVARLTDDVLDHGATGSPSGRFIVDVTSWVDVPGASRVLRSDGEFVFELEQSDVSQLYAAGWTPPERITAKAADGVTDLYGLLYKPHGFDPAGRYPILDDIYPGPQINAAPVRFLETGTAKHAASMAALGFAVVIIDGRGTPLRSRAFRDHCRGPHDADYLADHVAAIRQLAATRPWLDLDRVGIYGHSGGGRASTAAMLRHPDFFKVAVSTAGNHDDQIYHPGWGETYIGMIGEADYKGHSNMPYADRLTGRLLLMHGELDNNVHPYMTLRMVDALMTANKDFDLVIIPDADHRADAHQPYWLRRRWDYFVRHLHGQEPPEYRIADIPVSLDDLAAILS